jgi:hypothetical protein
VADELTYADARQKAMKYASTARHIDGCVFRACSIRDNGQRLLVESPHCSRVFHYDPETRPPPDPFDELNMIFRVDDENEASET